MLRTMPIPSTFRPVMLAFIALTCLLVTGLTAKPAYAFDTSAEFGVLIDADTGAVLWEKDADTRMHPASMSKLMTLSMLFDALEAGTAKLDDEFRVSEHAWRAGGAASGSSTMFAKVGSTIPVEVLIQGIIVQSGNDACIAVAEALSGSEPEFAIDMTKRGKELGLTDSTFANSTGWPDPDQMMTSHDLARLARHIINDFPQYYHYFSEKEFTWNGITQHNRNPALYLDPSVDGLKTGHTEEAGNCLVAIRWETSSSCQQKPALKKASAFSTGGSVHSSPTSSLPPMTWWTMPPSGRAPMPRYRLSSHPMSI